MTKLYRGFTSNELAESLQWIHCKPQGVYISNYIIAIVLTGMALQNFDMQKLESFENGSNQRVLLFRPASTATGAFMRSADRAGQDFMGVPCPSLGHRVSERTLKIKMNMLS